MSSTRDNFMPIDRFSDVPFYLQLARQLERDVRQGDMRPGDAMPSEGELCGTYGLARSTVRQGLRTLAARGCIRLVPRRGAFVVHPKEAGWVLQTAKGFFEGEVDHDRRSVHTELLEAATAPLPRAAARALNLNEGDAGFVLRRVRRLDGKVALFSINYLLPEVESLIIDSEVMTSSGSLNKVLERHGYVASTAKRTIEAVAASSALAKLLKVRNGWPVLLVSSLSWDRNMRPFDYHSTWVRTDVVKVTVDAFTAPT